MLNTQNVNLKMTAGRKDQFPRDGLVQIALSGRSNVGKSSLINTLLGRKSFARTSSSPGKTITINFYEVDKKLYLVDLPGYGYAKVAQSEKEKWGKLIEKYLNGSKQLRAVFLLIDIRHEPGANDKMMYEWICHNGYNPIIIATKLDKIKRSQTQKQLKLIRQGLNVLPGTIIIPYSSETKQGRDEVWELIEELCFETEAEGTPESE